MNKFLRIGTLLGGAFIGACAHEPATAQPGSSGQIAAAVPPPMQPARTTPEASSPAGAMIPMQRQVRPPSVPVAPVATPAPVAAPVPVVKKLPSVEVFTGFKNQATLAELPKLPLILKGCESGCCATLKNKKLPSSAELYPKPDDNTDMMGELKAGEAFKNAEAYMRVRKYGAGTVTQVGKKGGNGDLKVGDTFTVIRFVSETQILIWAKGRVRIATDEDFEGLQYKVKPEPDVEAWAKITRNDGTEGWASGPDLDWAPCAQ